MKERMGWKGRHSRWEEQQERREGEYVRVLVCTEHTGDRTHGNRRYVRHN